MEQLLEMLVGQKNKSNLSDIMNQFGLDEDQAKKAIGSLLPGVAQGIQKQAVSNNKSILEKIASSQQQRYLDGDEARLYDDESIADGNLILEQILGNKQASRELAGKVAQDSGIDNTTLKKLLPMVASMAMGALGKQAGQHGHQSSQSAIIDLVGSMFTHQNQRRGGLGIILNILGKFLRK